MRFVAELLFDLLDPTIVGDVARGSLQLDTLELLLQLVCLPKELGSNSLRLESKPKHNSVSESLLQKQLHIFGHLHCMTNASGCNVQARNQNTTTALQESVPNQCRLPPLPRNLCTDSGRSLVKQLRCLGFGLARCTFARCNRCLGRGVLTTVGLQST